MKQLERTDRAGREAPLCLFYHLACYTCSEKSALAMRWYER